MKNKALLFLTFIIVAALCIGCGKLEDITSNAVIVHDDGSVDAIIIDSFDKEYYNEDELVSLINKEVEEFNVAHGEGKIKLKSHEVKEGKITVKLSFADVQSYNSYMPDQIYVGTVGAAVSAGYDLNILMVSASDSDKTIGKNDLTEMNSKRVVIVSEALEVRTPGKISYYSQGMEKVDKKTVQAVNKGTYFVIYK